MSGSMPRPRSSISTAAPRPTTLAPTSIGHWGGENEEALSTSSASRWTRSSTAAPSTGRSGISPRMMRVDCSPAATAERMTSASGATSRPRSAASRPPMIIKFSALRRSRVDRWSTWTSRASCSASRSARTASSSTCCWRLRIVRLRWATVRNTAPAPARRWASSVAAATAHRCAAATAAPISPISPARSSADGSSASMSTVSPRRIRSSSAGSAAAVSFAAVRRPRTRPASLPPAHRAASVATAMSATTPSMTPTIAPRRSVASAEASATASRAVANARSDAFAATASPAAVSSSTAFGSSPARRPSSDRSRLGRARAPTGSRAEQPLRVAGERAPFRPVEQGGARVAAGLRQGPHRGSQGRPGRSDLRVQRAVRRHVQTTRHGRRQCEIGRPDRLRRREQVARRAKVPATSRSATGAAGTPSTAASGPTTGA